MECFNPKSIKSMSLHSPSSVFYHHMGPLARTTLEMSFKISLSTCKDYKSSDYKYLSTCKDYKKSSD